MIFSLWSLVLGHAPRALAHDPYESFALATVRADSLELNITMAQATALKLVDPQARIAGLTRENFGQVQAAFMREAEVLFVVTSIKTAIHPRSVVVELTEENDVSFKVYYARPAPGRLHFHAAFLKKLGEGYGGILDTADTDGHQLGWEQISWENPNLEITVPVAPAAAKKKT